MYDWIFVAKKIIIHVIKYLLVAHESAENIQTVYSAVNRSESNWERSAVCLGKFTLNTFANTPKKKKKLYEYILPGKIL